ncbi:PREDICTED: uroplakin-2 [Cercocebus atys]|nr:PREDICTED: uroplakin-2 [Cercocebus atys]
MAPLMPIQTLPLILILLAVLSPGIADFNISSLSGLLSPALTESLLVALPPCHLTGGNATLTVRRANDSKVVKSSFVVPPCRGRRELVSVVDSGAGFTVTRLSAYQVTNLVPGTQYYISYLVKKGTVTESSREIPMSTFPRSNMESIGLGMAHTGGMVVITVLLSVTMFLLVLGFIIALALGAHKTLSSLSLSLPPVLDPQHVRVGSRRVFLSVPRRDPEEIKGVKWTAPHLSCRQANSIAAGAFEKAPVKVAPQPPRSHSAPPRLCPPRRWT